MTDSCARCGRNRYDHLEQRFQHVLGGVLPCPGYRTDAQQEAWDRADKAARAWTEESSFGDHSVDIRLGGQMLDAIIRLRKVNP